MPFTQVDPFSALSKAFRQVKPTKAALEAFAFAAKRLIASARDGESEEFHKNLISTFLKDANFHADYFINTK